MAQWVSAATSEIEPELIQRSFSLCGITDQIDGVVDITKLHSRLQGHLKPEAVMQIESSDDEDLIDDFDDGKQFSNHSACFGFELFFFWNFCYRSS